jgi:hypothetical protein
MDRLTLMTAFLFSEVRMGARQDVELAVARVEVEESRNRSVSKRKTRSPR